MKQNRKVPKPPRDLRAVIHKKPTVFAVYLILRIVVLLTLVSSIIRGEYKNAFVCLLVLFLFMLPLRSVYKELHTNHGTGLLTTNKG